MSVLQRSARPWYISSAINFNVCLNPSFIKVAVSLKLFQRARKGSRKGSIEHNPQPSTSLCTFCVHFDPEIVFQIDLSKEQHGRHGCLRSTDTTRSQG